jgi:6-hydroxytryprostatin B O-methyltransferase
MENIAASISQNTKILAQELRKEGHPLPSFEQNSPVYFPLLSQEGCRARSELITAAEQILRLAYGPFEYLSWFSSLVKPPSPKYRPISPFQLLHI